MLSFPFKYIMYLPNHTNKYCLISSEESTIWRCGMRLNRWLVGLAPCIILLFILSLSVVDVEGRRGRKKRPRSKSRGHVPFDLRERRGHHRQGPSSSGGFERPGEVQGPYGPHVDQSTDNIVVAPTTHACPSGGMGIQYSHIIINWI